MYFNDISGISQMQKSTIGEGAGEEGMAALLGITIPIDLAE
jgi:hypothetical protein